MPTPAILKIPLTVLVKKGRKVVDKILLEYPVFLYNFGKSSKIYTIIDGGYLYDEELRLAKNWIPDLEKKLDVLESYRWSDEEYTYVAKTTSVTERSESVFDVIRVAVWKTILREELGFKRYTMKELTGGYGYTVYRIRKNVSLVISEPEDDLIVSKDSKEHDMLLAYEILEKEEDDLLFVGYFGVRITCPRCGKEFEFSTFRFTRCPACGENPLNSLEKLKSDILSSLSF